MGFNVIEVGTNRKPVCDFLLVINSNWHPISCRFGVIAAYCSNFGHVAFWAPLWGFLGQRTMFILCLLEARRGLPISVNWTFFDRCYGWGAKSENRFKKSEISLQRGHFDPKF